MFRPAVALIAVALVVPSARAAGDPLDEALYERAGSILDALKKKSFTNVGVVMQMAQQ